MNDYLKIARPDNWFKNVFILPGIVLAIYDSSNLIGIQLLWNTLLVVVSMCLMSSANYILNETSDALYDAEHPVKKNRPVPSGKINRKWACIEWIALTLASFTIAIILGKAVFIFVLLFWIAAGVYNVEPLRVKDIPHFDVLLEAINNPLRLLAGWYAVGITHPPASLVLSYWMIGAFFISVKRFAEYRHIDDSEK